MVSEIMLFSRSCGSSSVRSSRMTGMSGKSFPGRVMMLNSALPERMVAIPRSLVSMERVSSGRRRMMSKRMRPLSTALSPAVAVAGREVTMPVSRL